MQIANAASLSFQKHLCQHRLPQPLDAMQAKLAAKGA
jgi:hypothetical protein